MKGLSLWQPWGSAVVPYFMKGNETRSWPTHYRGLLAIHAAKRPVSEDVLDITFWDELRSAMLVHGHDELPLGALLGVVRLVDCVRVETIRDGLTDRERRWGNYTDGRFAWKLEPVHVLREPIPYRGAQGLFEVPLVLRAGEFVLDQDDAKPPPSVAAVCQTCSGWVLIQLDAGTDQVKADVKRCAKKGRRIVYGTEAEIAAIARDGHACKCGRSAEQLELLR